MSSDVRPLSAPQKSHLLEVVGKAHDAIGHVMHDFSGETPARAEVRRQLNASVAAEAAVEIGHYLADLKQRLVAAGEITEHAEICALIWQDGSGHISAGGRQFGTSRRAFKEAVEEAEAFRASLPGPEAA